MSSLLEMDWASRIGWLGFFILLGAMASGHTLFDPFVFGATYYIAHTCTRLQRLKGFKESTPLFILAGIGLLYAWLHVFHGVDDRAFIRKLDSLCLAAPAGQEGFCESVKEAYEGSRTRFVSGLEP